MRLNADFVSGFKLIWVVQPFREKYLACAVGQISGLESRHPALPEEGRIAIVTTRGAGCDGRDGII